MKGKNFSCNNVTKKRNKSDFYQTHHSMTEQLLENEKFHRHWQILEPACGEEAIVCVLDYKKFFNLTWYDIKESENLDFLYEENKYDAIITNPPFSLAFEFIQKAKEIATEKFAMLLPLSYLHGQKRFESGIFTDPNYPLTRVYVFTRYPMLSDTIREDGKYNTGMMVYAWFVWEKTEKKTYFIDGKFQKVNDRITNYPQIKWINNQKYILKKQDIK